MAMHSVGASIRQTARAALRAGRCATRSEHMRASSAAGGACPWGGSFAAAPAAQRNAATGPPTGRSAPQRTAAAATDPAVSETLALLEQKIGKLDHGLMVPPPSPRVVVISGSSGVGKDSVIAELKRLRPDLHFVITATSRAMRPGEVHGRDYFFVTKLQFEEWIAAGRLIEHAVVYGEYKGIPAEQVEAALQRGTDVVMRLDVQGAATVRQLMPEVISIFLAAESEASLVTRLVGRATEPIDKLITRVQTAREETARMAEFDYVVVNRAGRLQETAEAIAGIIETEKRRVAAPGGAAAARR